MSIFIAVLLCWYIIGTVSYIAGFFIFEEDITVSEMFRIPFTGVFGLLILLSLVDEIQRVPGNPVSEFLNRPLIKLDKNKRKA